MQQHLTTHWYGAVLQADPFAFVFTQRVFESAAIDVYDNDRVMEQCLDTDWKRIMTKQTLRAKLLAGCGHDAKVVSSSWRVSARGLASVNGGCPSLKPPKPTCGTTFGSSTTCSTTSAS